MDNSGLEKCVKDCIDNYRKRLSDKLNEIDLDNLLGRSNPYLLRSKVLSGELSSIEKIVDYLIQTYKTESEQTIFGEFFEDVYYFLAESNGWSLEISPPFEGIDCICTKEICDIVAKKAVSIKSGPSWGNSDQLKRMEENFNRVKDRYPGIECINMCGYGNDPNPDKKQGYKKLCGQRGWADISDDLNAYKKIMNALSCMIAINIDNRDALVEDFERKFCREDGKINWEKLLEYNSEAGKKCENVKKFEVNKQQVRLDF